MIDEASNKRLTIIEQILQTVVGILQVQGAKLDAILEAATAPAGPSQTTELLKQIVVSQEQTIEALQDLPANLAVAIRHEMDLEDENEPDMEPAGPGGFDS